MAINEKSPSPAPAIVESEPATRCGSNTPGLAATSSNNGEKPIAHASLEERAGALAVPPPSGTTSSRYRWLVHVQFFACCWAMVVAGWNDGSTGPLLPRIQEVYGVNYTIVSLVWVFACVGFLTGAIANMFLEPRFGFGKTIFIGACFQFVGYAIESAALPFPAFVLGYAINGVGMALQDAQANGYVSNLPNSSTKMSFLHAAYGLGALASPLAATQFAQLPHWSFHFLISFGVALLDAIILAAVFRFKTHDECLAAIGQVRHLDEPSEKNDDSGSETEKSHFRKVMTLKETHLMAVFILVYVGVEVTVGGWTVTYVINERNGGPSSGYISTGFFGGLTLGRMGLIWANNKIGERKALVIYAALAIGLELVVWLVHSLVGDAIAVSFVGFFLGPMYPIAMNVCGRIIPPSLLTGSIGWIAGLGQAGSALFPFITGAISNKAGIESLQPIVVAMMAFTIGLWICVPRDKVRTASPSSSSPEGAGAIPPPPRPVVNV
ncbi:MFS general substrate transporter [Coniophora puteana RWD-64-598 SS2]|uniref:MFS general substrate transporter n=1 Tax=Coniophora puteana (strain RWD-64-598) TaxID=741705 RepID=A0A5M3MIL6_CONPW|nr:MFS general substrate transporter [Coniophora puteana RWD-64-598 SS2]EIW78485.1 MFS general substrate transporter [Coniophora puteana RWD-64-598 SS2]